jgi:hypothetical protein
MWLLRLMTIVGVRVWVLHCEGLAIVRSPALQLAEPYIHFFALKVCCHTGLATYLNEWIGY